ncbi:MAG: efflux RND transporter periplasmic adaptor subunit [Candidatus Aminicenantes bacterium]|nr:efflux RND transporter periplasmic adaptor subunit [Candidatus Aminicenantes bacterium]
MNNNAKINKALNLILGLVVLWCLTGCKAETPQEAAPVVRPIKTMVIGGDVGGRLSFPGRVQATQRVNLTFRVAGPLIEFPVMEGQAVTRGQFLARIDPRDYRIALDEARAGFERAESDFKRYQRLYEKEAVPISDLDLYRSQRDVAKARLDKAEADIKDTRLLAPFSGNIGTKFVENYEEVRSNQEVLSLHDISRMEIVVDLPEYLMATITESGSVRLVAAFEVLPGQELPVRFSEASAEADPQTQTYQVTLTLPQPGGIRLLPGMNSEVRLYGRPALMVEADVEYVIPANAVMSADDGTAYVWKVDPENATVHRVDVEVGSVTGVGNIRILKGLNLGDRIAIAGVTLLKEGMTIQPQDE